MIGPVVADTASDARALISYHLRDLKGQFVRLDIGVNDKLSAWLTNMGLRTINLSKDALRDALAQGTQSQAHRSVNFSSIRRFCARASGVSAGFTGWNSPNPLAASRFGGMPSALTI